MKSESDGKFDFAIPESGGTLWSDNLLIPSTSTHKKNAEKLMNYYYEPAVAAEVAAYVNYICPVEAAQSELEKIDPALAASPFIFPDAATLEKFISLHEKNGCAVSVLSVVLDDPFGYGRILRDGEGMLTGIVEEKDAADDQRKISEINTGIVYVFAVSVMVYSWASSTEGVMLNGSSHGSRIFRSWATVYSTTFRG